MLITLAWRNIFRNPWRSLITTFAVCAGIWSVVSLFALARGVSDQLVGNVINTLTGHIQIHAVGYVDDPSPTLSFLLKPTQKEYLDHNPVIKSWADRVRVPGIIMSERDSAGIVLLGIDPQKEAGMTFLQHSITQGENLRGIEDPKIILGKKLVEDLQTGLGKRVVILAQAKDGSVKDRGFVVAGVYDTELESTERNYVFLGKKVAQEFLGLGEQISEVSLISSLGRNELDAVLQNLKSKFTDLDLQVWSTLEPFVAAIVNIQDGFLIIWAVVVVIAIGFGLVNTLFMAIFERTREIGLLQALGMKPRMIIWEFLIEGVFLLLLGLFVGNICGLITVYFFKDGLELTSFDQGVAMVGMSRKLYPVVKGFDLIMANLLIISLGTLSVIYPAWRAGKYLPVEALSKG